MKYGESIDVEVFADGFSAAREDEKIDVASREAVRALTAEIEKRMAGLTINAPDW